MTQPRSLKQMVEEGFDFGDGIPNKMRVQESWILFERDVPQEETHTGITIPQAARQQRPTGVVLAVGPDVKLAQPGDRIAFPDYAVTTCSPMENVTCFFIPEKEVFCVFKPDGTPR